MWGDKKTDAPARPPLPQQPRTNATSGGTSISGEAKTMAPLDSSYPASSSGIARLGASLHVKGEITGNEDLAIDGSVEGLVQLEDRKLTIGASAKVTADVIAREVVVYGNVKGNLRARDRIEIKKDGSVVGDLTTARIMIEDGAYFKGSIEIDKAGDASDSHDLDKPAFTRTSRSAATTASSTD
jgi:cytoskeletal protein CcmA (bactofilin family)